MLLGADGATVPIPRRLVHTASAEAAPTLVPHHAPDTIIRGVVRLPRLASDAGSMSSIPAMQDHVQAVLRLRLTHAGYNVASVEVPVTARPHVGTTWHTSVHLISGEIMVLRCQVQRPLRTFCRLAVVYADVVPAHAGLNESDVTPALDADLARDRVPH